MSLVKWMREMRWQNRGHPEVSEWYEYEQMVVATREFDLCLAGVCVLPSITCILMESSDCLICAQFAYRSANGIVITNGICSSLESLKLRQHSTLRSPSMHVFTALLSFSCRCVARVFIGRKISHNVHHIAVLRFVSNQFTTDRHSHTHTH